MSKPLSTQEKAELKEWDETKQTEIEHELLIAPMRMFRHTEMRGYYAPELMEKFGVTKIQLVKMKNSRRTFFSTHKIFESKEVLFFWLR